MEDKRTALALLLCVLVIYFYSELYLKPQFTPPTTQPAPEQSATVTPQPVAQNIQTPPTPPGNPKNTKGPTLTELDKNGAIVINTGVTSVKIYRLGGRISSVRLNRYKNHLGDDLLMDLVQIPDGEVLPLGVSINGQSDLNTVYTLESITGAIKGGSNDYSFDDISNSLVILLSGQLPNQQTIKKQITFHRDSYVIGLTILHDPNSAVWIDWVKFIPELLRNDRLDAPNFTLLGDNNKISHIPAINVVNGLSAQGANTWASIGDKYFVSSLIPPSTGANTQIHRENDIYTLQVGGSAGSEFEIFCGPKDIDLLRSAGHQLERNINLGTFAFLAQPLLAVIRFFYKIFGNYGLSIILLTLVIKALFLPLTKASFKSMQAMQQIQPEMQALRARIKDATELNKAMLELYKQKGVNPMGGCLPILIQLPVFLGLYNALLNSIDLRHAPFALWINDLSAPERLLIFGIPVPVMIIIMGISMIVQQWLTPTTGDPAQKKAMMMVPFVFTIMFIIFPFPAGLVLYWLVNNSISIIQQIYLKTDRKASPGMATLVASIAIFVLGYVLTLV